MGAEEKSPKSGSIREGRQRAQIALLDIISDTVDEIRGNGYTLSGQASTVLALATAYRAIEGGPQPSRSES